MPEREPELERTTPELADLELANLDRTARIARDLIRFDTTNWGEGRSEGEEDAAEYVAARLTAIGLPVERYDSAPGRRTIVTRVPGREPELPALVVHGHLDVVPADASAWSVDPFEGVVKDGMLWGRGAVDMKNMCAMMIAALETMHERGEQPRRPLIVVFFADEENGGAWGSRWLVEHHPEVFAGATEAISEVGGFSVTLDGRRAYLVQTAEKALIWLKLVATGTASHGSQYMQDNAITRLARAVIAIGEHEWPLEFTPTTKALIAELARLTNAPDDATPDEIAARAGEVQRFLRATLRHTSNPTQLDAGYKHNVIPGRAEARIDVRPLPGREADVLAEVQRIVGDDIEIEIVTQDVGLEQPFEGPLVDAMSDVLRRHDPEAAILPYMLSGGTDNKALSELGIRGYGFAPLRLTPDLDFAAMFHGVDERVPLDALEFGRVVLTDLLLEY